MGKYDVGTIHKTNENCFIEIIEKVTSNTSTIKFLDNFNFKTTAYNINILRGEIKNPFKPSMFGVGYLGDINFKTSEKGLKIKQYSIWKGVLERCYSENSISKTYAYKNVTVCEEWHCFNNFYNWFNYTYPQNIEGINFELDKDILQQNIENKIYSPKTCVWLPSLVNSFLTNVHKNNTTGYVGVYKLKNIDKYASQIQLFGENKKVHLGRFSTPEEASQAYQTARAINAEKAKQYLRDLNYLPEHIIQLIK